MQIHYHTIIIHILPKHKQITIKPFFKSPPKQQTFDTGNRFMHSQTQKEVEVNTTHRLFTLAPLVSLQHLSVVIISDLHRTESSWPLGTVISCRYMHHQ